MSLTSGSSTICRLNTSTDSLIALAFFYCDYKDSQTHDVVTILGSLARQLISQSQDAFDDLKSFYRDHHSKDQSIQKATPWELCALIQRVSTHFKTTVIVVDGLDEISNNRGDVAKLLAGLDTSDRRIKTLFASRPEVDIEYQLRSFVKISIAATSTDLISYVGYEIKQREVDGKLKIKDPDLKSHIMETLVKSSDGMLVLQSKRLNS